MIVTEFHNPVDSSKILGCPDEFEKESVANTDFVLTVTGENAAYFEYTKTLIKNCLCYSNRGGGWLSQISRGGMQTRGRDLFDLDGDTALNTNLN